MMTNDDLADIEKRLWSGGVISRKDIMALLTEVRESHDREREQEDADRETQMYLSDDLHNAQAEVRRLQKLLDAAPEQGERKGLLRALVRCVDAREQLRKERDESRRSEKVSAGELRLMLALLEVEMKENKRLQEGIQHAIDIEGPYWRVTEALRALLTRDDKEADADGNG